MKTIGLNEFGDSESVVCEIQPQVMSPTELEKANSRSQ